MQVSLHWLQELVACDLLATELAERLSVAGFEVETIEDLAARAAGVVVGHVDSREQHPNADKLSVCTVNIGAAEPLQIVCGASNVRAGIHVAVATVGAYLPAVDLTIKPAELRGVASSGMICSLSELGLADTSRAMPCIDRPSGRLAVIASSSTWSSRPNRGPTAVPRGGTSVRASSSTTIPLLVSTSPSSASEQIMPLLATPRSSAGLMVRFTAGKWEPTVATATWIPALTLEAPQTI